MARHSPQASFTPYWKVVGQVEEPLSWVFFVVANINGHSGFPVAVVTSVGDISWLEHSLQGPGLISACHRILTAFSDKTNHITIHAELNLAADYYNTSHVGHDGGPAVLELVELPALDRRQSQPELRYRPLEKGAVQPFPFITSCLVQAVGFPAVSGVCHSARPEPLGTVYRDSSGEWGMVAIDITDLDAVSYGIVAFGTAPMRYIASPRDANPFHGATGCGVLESGPFRAVDGARPRVPMSAVEYAEGFERELEVTAEVKELLDQRPLVSAAALRIIWPMNPSQSALADLTLSAKANSEGPTPGDQMISIFQLIRRDFEEGRWDTAALDRLRTSMPNFQQCLRICLVRLLKQESGWSFEAAPTHASDLLCEAFLVDGHLWLETLPVVDTGFLLGIPSTTISKITSISLCIECVRGPLDEFVNSLTAMTTLRHISFLQQPARTNDDVISGEVMFLLGRQPSFLKKVEVTFAGAHSASLQGRTLFSRSSPGNSVRGAGGIAPLLQFYPVQQIILGHQPSPRQPDQHKFYCLDIVNSLLEPERLVSGFLLYLWALVAPGSDLYNNICPTAFAVSSAPRHFTCDRRHFAHICPAVNAHSLTAIQPLLPQGWTVIVTVGSHMYKSEDIIGIRYAFVRASRQMIDTQGIDRQGYSGPRNIEAFSLAQFLMSAAPELSSAAADQRLDEIAAMLRNDTDRDTLPAHSSPVLVLSREEALGVLKRSFTDARVYY